jgi:DhnA family fructose-bisphosphate aldolase class Ia
MDHGLWVGPQKRINDPLKSLRIYINGGAPSVLLNPGFYRAVVDIGNPEIGMILRLGATTNISPEGEQEIPVADVEQLIPLLIN